MEPTTFIIRVGGGTHRVSGAVADDNAKATDMAAGDVIHVGGRLRIVTDAWNGNVHYLGDDGRRRDAPLRGVRFIRLGGYTRAALREVAMKHRAQEPSPATALDFLRRALAGVEPYGTGTRRWTAVDVTDASQGDEVLADGAWRVIRGFIIANGERYLAYDGGDGSRCTPASHTLRIRRRNDVVATRAVRTGAGAAVEDTDKWIGPFTWQDGEADATHHDPADAGHVTAAGKEPGQAAENDTHAHGHTDDDAARFIDDPATRLNGKAGTDDDRRYDYYMAGPFFDETQLEALMESERIVGGLGNRMFCPRYISSLERDGAGNTYRSDINGIERSDALIATFPNPADEPLDEGTAWEMGYAHALGIPVILVVDGLDEDTPMNIMLAESSDVILDGHEALERYMRTGEHDRPKLRRV